VRERAADEHAAGDGCDRERRDDAGARPAPVAALDEPDRERADRDEGRQL
jgi:hypothetical protein